MIGPAIAIALLAGRLILWMAKERPRHYREVSGSVDGLSSYRQRNSAFNTHSLRGADLELHNTLSAIGRSLSNPSLHDFDSPERFSGYERTWRRELDELAHSLNTIRESRVNISDLSSFSSSSRRRRPHAYVFDRLTGELREE